MTTQLASKSVLELKLAFCAGEELVISHPHTDCVGVLVHNGSKVEVWVAVACGVLVGAVVEVGARVDVSRGAFWVRFAITVIADCVLTASRVDWISAVGASVGMGVGLLQLASTAISRIPPMILKVECLKLI